MAVTWQAPLLAFILALLLGPLVIGFLRTLQVGQNIRAEGPKRHLAKAGTPTMGGWIFLIPVIITFWLTPGLHTIPAITVLAATLGYSLIGFADDYLKVVRRRSLGLKARQKLLAQFFLGISLWYMAIYVLNRGTVVTLPIANLSWDLGWFYLPFVVLVVVATSNAVNLTDGLDGLAAGLAVVSFGGMAWLSYLRGSPDLTLAALTLAGASAGFLFYNRHPARIFMGDTGSLGLGAGLAALAILTRTELLLPVLGLVFVLEALSVIIQVAVFQTTGQRLLRMSPLHHHFELGGWSEWRVVLSFWLAGTLAALVSIYLI